MKKNIVLSLAFFVIQNSFAQIQPKNFTNAINEILPSVVEWRRDFHQHPELSNREFRTQEKVYAYLKSLGLEVTKIAKTGVKAILKTNKPGAVIALRADIDALPVEEKNDLIFKSTTKANYNGTEVSVMHACGHDAHTAMLMGTAAVLSKLKNEI